MLACVKAECKAGAKVVDVAQIGDNLIEESVPILLILCNRK